MAEQQVNNQDATEDPTVKGAPSKFKVPLPFSTAHRPSTMIGATFLVIGTTTLLVSIFLNSQIVALVGLGLAFWGALFIIFTPLHYVESSLLNSTAISTYLTIDRIIKDNEYQGNAYYLPPYSQEEYLPENLKGLKETIAFISANKDATMPPIEDLAKSKFNLTNRKGVLIVPPGLGLLTKIEKKMAPTTKIGVSEIFEVVPKIISEDFGLAREIEMKSEDDSVKLTIHDSLYMNLYNPGSNLKSISLLGCPIASAIACVIAKHTGRPVILKNIKVTPERPTVEIKYQLVLG